MGMTALQAETLKLWRESGENAAELSRRLGKNPSTVQKIIKTGLAWEDLDSGHAAALENTGLGVERAKFGWRIVQHDDGSRDSVFWDARSAVDEVDPVSITDAIKDALSGVGRAISQPVVTTLAKDICVVFPVADLHMGLLTDAEEVGVDWDSGKAMVAFEATFGELVRRTPDSEVAILAQLGDLTHNDDQRNVTPGHKHQLDVDGRYFRIVRNAVAVMKWSIDLLRQRYPKVVYRGCRGNHDVTTHIAVTIALAEHYRDCAEVEIVDSASEFYVHEFGSNMFVFHHGDKAKPERLLPFLANEWSEVWGRTKHRVTFSGHVHHEWAKEMAGMLFRSVGTIVPRDYHAFSNAYGSTRCLMSFTYDGAGGEIATARVNL